MPVLLADSTSGLIRTTGLPTGDYTCIVKFKPVTNNPSGGLYRTMMGQLIDATLVGNTITSYLGEAVIFSNVNSSGSILTVKFGSSSSTLNINLSLGTQITLVYVRKGTSHYYLFKQSGQSGMIRIGSIVKSFTGANINALILGNDGTPSWSNDEFAYFRDWSAALSYEELTIESMSTRAARTADLISDCPFESDLLDKSGNGNHFLNQGVAGTFTTAVPTPNFTIGSLPYSQVVPQATFNISNQVWFKYTNTTTKAVGIFSSTTPTSIFEPVNQLYEADGVTKVLSYSGAVYAIIGPGDYYFRVFNHTNGATDIDFTTYIKSLPLLTTASAGDVIINDDTAGFSGVVANPSSGLKGLMSVIPSSEFGSATSSGITLWHDRFNYDDNQKLKLIDSDFSVIVQVSIPGLVGSTLQNPISICVSSKGINFYIADTTPTGVGKVWKLTVDGVLTDTGITLPNYIQISGIGVNLDETIFYYSQVNTSTINRWDIVNNINLGVFYTAPLSVDICLTADNGNNGDILTLQDDSIVFYYQDFTNFFSHLIHLSSTGTLLHDYSYSTGSGSDGIDHINYTGNSDNINIWLYQSNADVGKFGTLNLTTGVIAPFITNELYATYGNLNFDFDLVNIFGPSNSCNMITYIYRNSGGIYKIVPEKRQDTLWEDVNAQTTVDVRIPNPLFRTALMGD